jgi:hypothetical protein
MRFVEPAAGVEYIGENRGGSGGRLSLRYLLNSFDHLSQYSRLDGRIPHCQNTLGKGLDASGRNPKHP